MRFLGALAEGVKAEAVIFGVPFDGTASFRAGARFGPGAIRAGSHSLETFSPFIDRDLEFITYSDWGDLEVPPGSAARTVELVADKVRHIYQSGAAPLVLGGEHTITLGAVQAAFETYPDLEILQLDAHTDLREDYLGEKLSHATVIKRIMDFIPANRIHRFGVRAGTREEIVGAGIEVPLGIVGGQRDIEKSLGRISDNIPLYVTIDLDVFDPSLVPGVGNPEPLGLTYREFIQVARLLSRCKLIGVDVVELAPHFDQTGVSSVVAASVVREMLLCLVEASA
jgi:agmatinase